MVRDICEAYDVPDERKDIAYLLQGLTFDAIRSSLGDGDVFQRESFLLLQIGPFRQLNEAYAIPSVQVHIITFGHSDVIIQC